MTAAKTRLKEFKHKDGRSVFAAKITDIEPFTQPGPAGAMTLHFVKPTGPSKSHLIPQWISTHKPQVGGYFVVEDDDSGKTSCRYQDAETFEKEYK